MLKIVVGGALNKNELDRLRSSVKLSCNQLLLDVFKVVDHTLPGLVSTAD